MSERTSLPGVSTPPVEVTIATLDLTYEELISPGYREELDRVVRAISLERDIEYVEALEALRRWRAAAAGRRVPLSAVIQLSPITLSQMVEQVYTLARLEV